MHIMHRPTLGQDLRRVKILSFSHEELPNEQPFVIKTLEIIDELLFGLNIQVVLQW